MPVELWFAAMVLAHLLTVYILARRLPRIDPVLTAGAYFWRLGRLQRSLYLLFTDSDVSKRPDGQPLHPAFSKYVGLTVLSCIFWIVMFALWQFKLRRMFSA